MKRKEDLLIEFRAVPYVGDFHALEFRFAPDQDLSYVKQHSLFWGLIKFTTVALYKNDWEMPVTFFKGVTSYLYPENDSYNCSHPIFIRNQSDLRHFKNDFKTYGEFAQWCHERDSKERNEYRKERKEYLDKHKVWY